MFAGLAAHLLFILQILVYAGAIVVLIVFVIMLLNLREEDLAPLAVEKGKFAVAAIAAAAGCALVLRSLSGLPGLWRPVPPEFGTAQDVAGALFTRFLIPFEILGLILLVGIMGAVVLAKKGE
ncbi:MAG: NADH-quinone oxidoreductase subunit J [Candidatus Eisenbacteria bacterium]|nr:NADH-quinone oxidoreductase subunit J [Candidatus Eisenbacteria bacterium]